MAASGPVTRALYALEGVGLWALFFVMGLLPVAWASGFGGLVARTMGPLTRAHKKALRHVTMAMPETAPAEREALLLSMWDNMGRVIAEYPHLRTICASRVELRGGAVAERIRDAGRGALFISGHVANWEVLVPFFIRQTGISMALTYREPNNPWVASLLSHARTRAGVTEALGKGERRTGPRLIHTLKRGGFAGMLIDQKYNEGLLVPFFGLDAMTNPVAARVARKFDVPLVMTRIERLPGARFVVTVCEPIAVADRTDADVLAELHTMLEGWIRERPGQWLWLHRRWGNEHGG